MKNTEFEILNPGSREAWLKYRAGGLGSSDIPTILGLNVEYGETPYTLWERKLGLREGKEENHVMEMGHYFELAISAYWQDHTGRKVIQSSVGDWMFRCKEMPWRMASPDRTYWLGEARNVNDWSQKGILELKSTAYDPTKKPVLMQKWFSQVMWQLGNSPMRNASIAWMIRNFECPIEYRDWNFNADFFSDCYDIADEFWNKNVKEKIAPQPISASDIAAMFPKEISGQRNEVDADTAKMVADLKAIKGDIKDLEEKEKTMQDAIIMKIGDAEGITFGGELLATYKAAKASSKFDAKSFQTANPELYAQFCHEVAGSRRFLLK